MKKNGLLNPLRYICLICVFGLGLMSIVGSGGGGDLYISPCFPFPESWCTPSPAENIPPKVTYNYPRNQESWIPVTTTIRVHFSEEMYYASITSSTFFITDNLGNPVEGTITYNEDGSTLEPLEAIFTPYSELDPNAIYNATVTKGVMDAAGNNLEYNFSWSFITGPKGIGIWKATSLTDVPPAKSKYTAVWTDTEMIVYSGDTGACYDPITDIWYPISMVGAPEKRYGHTAIWTGSEMIVWGGVAGYALSYNYLNTGARYNPDTDTWKPISIIGAPEGRSEHTAIWTGSEMIVWGGRNGGFLPTDPNSGGSYNPVTDTWQTITSVGAPMERRRHSAIWTGAEMVIWGGLYSINNNQFYLSSGGCYNPATNTWNATSTINAPEGRVLHTAVWSGTEMIIWGGSNGDNDLNTGGRYEPSSDTWQPTSTNNVILERWGHTAIWTGVEMIVWGGYKGGEFWRYNFYGGRYNLNLDSWTATSTTNAPKGRTNHIAVWTDTDMIVWGGTSGNNGGVYTP